MSLSMEEYGSYMQQLLQNANEQKHKQEVTTIKKERKQATKLIRKTFSKTHHHAKSGF